MGGTSALTARFPFIELDRGGWFCPMRYSAGNTGRTTATRRVNSMASNKSARAPVVPELAAAGVVLIAGAVGAARLALVPPTDIPVSPTVWSALMLLLAVGLAVSGIESIRRRHFLFVVLVPTAPALVSPGYVIGTGQTAYLNSVWIPVVVMAMVASKRSNFT
jgi:hypothetical protein